MDLYVKVTFTGVKADRLKTHKKRLNSHQLPTFTFMILLFIFMDWCEILLNHYLVLAILPVYGSQVSSYRLLKHDFKRVSWSLRTAALIFEVHAQQCELWRHKGPFEYSGLRVCCLATIIPAITTHATQPRATNPALTTALREKHLTSSG